MDDDILLGNKMPDDDSNIDLRAVTQLGFQSRFNNDQYEPSNRHNQTE